VSTQERELEAQALSLYWELAHPLVQVPTSSHCLGSSVERQVDRHLPKCSSVQQAWSHERSGPRLGSSKAEEKMLWPWLPWLP
jgi:hypothetical protein